MSDTSPILDLPFLLPSQAQKHVTYNEALRRLDIVVQLRVMAFDAETPPEIPEEGDIHALGASPVAAWAGQAHTLAVWLDGTWHFVSPQDGWRAWGTTEQQLRVWNGADWILPPAQLDNLPGIGIGTASDDTNRLAVQADATLLNHAGTDHRLKINKGDEADTASLLFQSAWTGHAEMGLAGDTDFAIKVSGDGSAWTDAIRFDATTGLASGAAIQNAPTDTTPGALMTVGAFGLGTKTAPQVTDFNDANMAGFYSVLNLSNALNKPPGFNGGTAALWVGSSTNGNNMVQIAFYLNEGGVIATRSLRAGNWRDWQVIYTQATIVGPVAQSEGIPTGAVVERGSTSDGDYVRWADGTQICTNANNPITEAPAAFEGPITKIDGDKLWIGRWF